MSQLTHINAGIRGLFCAGIATMITAAFSWSFVDSTDSLNWMGSGTPEFAMRQTETAFSSGGA